jgi:TonB-linked SusC/RagA family outer membrane protein
MQTDTFVPPPWRTNTFQSLSAAGSSLAAGIARAAAACLFLFALIGLAAPAGVQAQITVSGTVTEAESGDVLPGVNVRVVGTQIGTATGRNGEYTIEAPSEDATLRFSFVGYETQEVAVDGRSTIDVTLASRTLTGSEVVVTGYSTQRRRDLTGSVEVADVDQIKKASSPQVTESLQGQVSGVTINSSGQPGDQPQINIRGLNTFGNNTPLFVVDGVPTQDISYLNPQDIESLQVLKDAGAASQYGARAANGVVVITTNSGSGDLTVNYSASVGYQVPQGGNVWNALSPQEQGQLEFMAQRNTDPGETPSHAIWGTGEPTVPEWILPARADDPNTENYFVDPDYTEAGALSEFNQFIRANQQGTNWFDEITEPATQTNHNLSVGGGGERGNYYASVSYTNQQGTVMNTYLERYTVRANTEFDVTDNIRIGENLTFSVSENPQAGTVAEGSAIGFSFRAPSIIPVHDIENNFAGTIAPDLGNSENPVAIRHRARTDDGEDRRLFGNVFVEADFLSDFRFRTSFGADITSGYFKFFTYPTYENSENVTTNAYTEQFFNNRSWTWSNTLNFERTFGQNHNVTALAGFEAVQNTDRFDEVSRQGYFSFSPDFANLGTGAGTPNVNTSARTVDALLSLIGNVDYDYNNTYLLSVTLRRDGSSKFLNNQWGTFPSVTAGWRASELEALQSIDWLTDLKIRGGYGVMGNQLNVDPNNAFTLFGGTQQNAYYAIDGSNSATRQGFRQVRIGNPDAKWERNVNVNVGVDLAVFDGQLELTADYYRKEVEDLLFDPALLATAGAAAPPFRNVASMRNQGIDVSLRGGTDVSEDLTLNGQATVTTYSNEIQSIAPGVDQFSLDARRFGTEIIRNEVGHPISSFYGYDIVGFWQNEEEIQQADADAPDGQFMADAAPGRFRYRDVNGDGQITTADRTHLGDPHPTFTYGLNLNATYKNWDATAFFYGEQGKDIWNQTKWWRDFRGTFQGQKSQTALYDSWQEEGDTMGEVSAPIQEVGQFFSTSSVPNSYYIEDGSYLRLQNVQLGYTLPQSLLQIAGLKSLRIYAQAENVFTITGYSGLTPEIGNTQSADAGTPNFGIDEGTYPNPRTFTMGVNLSF